MIDIKEIEMEIQKLEQCETSYATCSKLADLYAVIDHFKKPKKEAAYSYGQSEFLTAVSTAPIDQVLELMDEHMDAIKILHPREYAAVIKRIKSL